MKRLLFLVAFITLAMSSIAQNVDADRVNIRKNFTMPLLDTIAAALKIGEERTRPQDSLVWYWQGLRWVNLRGVVSVKDTIPLFHIGAGAPALRPIYAINGALRASNWGQGYGWVPRLLGDSTMVGDVDTTSIAYKQWVINQFSPGGPFSVGFQNGLSLSSSNGELGGSLIHVTSINTGTFQLTVTGNRTSSAPFNLSNSGDGPALITSMSSISQSSSFFINTGTGPSITATTNGGVTFIGQTTDNVNTNTVLPTLQLRRQTALGTAGAGIGQSIEFYIATLGSSLLSNSIVSKWTDPTDVTRTSQWILNGVGNATTRALITFNGNGQGIMTNTVSFGTLFAVSNTEPTNNNIAISGTSINGGGVSGVSTTNSGVTGQSASGFGGQFSSSTGSGLSATTNSSTNAAGLFAVVPSTTNTVRTVATFQRNTSLTAANGIGSAIEIFNQTSTSSVAGNTLISILTDATGAAPTSQYSIKGNNASSAQSLLWTLDGNGNVTTTGGLIIRPPLLTAAGTYTILANDYEVVATGTTSTWTLPAHVAGRSLKLVNQGSGAITIAGGPIRTDNATTVTTIAAGSNFIVDDDGTTYRKTN